MGWMLDAVGVGLAATGIIAGTKQEGPESISVKYPEPDPIEKEMASFQLKTALELKERIDDPKILQDIFKLLPETKMSAEDRARFTSEYADITKRVTLQNMEQGKMAMGETLDSLVERGVMTQKQADNQRIQNEARINAMMSVLSKRLEASRIGMARNTWLQEQQGNAGMASTIAKVDQTNRSMLNATLESGLNYFANRDQNVTGLQAKVNSANLQNFLGTSESKFNFQQNALLSSTNTALTGLKEYQDKQILEEALKKGDITQSEATKYKLFSRLGGKSKLSDLLD